MKKSVKNPLQQLNSTATFVKIRKIKAPDSSGGNI